MNPYAIALTLVPGLGNKGIRQLLAVDKELNPEKIFSLSPSQLDEIFGKHKKISNAIASKAVLHDAEKTLEELEKHHISVLFCTDSAYPQRLNREGCEDTPVLLYCLGTCDLNAPHSVAVVGTRHASDYGRTTTHRLINEMSFDKPLIVSGLAYGIDTEAHQASLQYGLPTVAVLGHGLDRIYPPQNRQLAKQILDSGGALVTEYPMGASVSPSNFPARNRTIAAMSDATVVVEAAEKGGALITANLASGYNREVFAVPGRLDDTYSAGCNNLIANNKAAILRNAGDLFFQLGWKYKTDTANAQERQQSLFATLNRDEQKMHRLLEENREMTMDDFAAKSNFPFPKIAALLTELELKNVIRCLPGRIYKLV